VIWQIYVFHHVDIDSPLLFTAQVLDAGVLVAVGLDKEADRPLTSLAAYVELM
jgi:hypothetical protein